jgi:hypothetical protein
LFYKLRHRRGHGIHSPFAFRLITHVIEEQRPYYAYQDIREYLLLFPPKIKKNLKKSDRLAFRLVNYFDAKKILEIGSGYGINTLCLTAPSAQTECICVELSSQKCETANELYKDWKRRITVQNTLPVSDEKQDCICLDLRYYTAGLENMESYLLNNVADHSFILIKGIRANRPALVLWENLVRHEQVRVSLDLFHDGILFFFPKLHKKHYKISF